MNYDCKFEPEDFDFCINQDNLLLVSLKDNSYFQPADFFAIIYEYNPNLIEEADLQELEEDTEYLKYFEFDCDWDYLERALLALGLEINPDLESYYA